MYIAKSNDSLIFAIDIMLNSKYKTLQYFIIQRFQYINMIMIITKMMKIRICIQHNNQPKLLPQNKDAILPL